MIKTNLLKLSGNESKLLEGANLVKKMSDPPYAKSKVCDSRFAAVEIIDVAPATVLVYDDVRSGGM